MNYSFRVWIFVCLISLGCLVDVQSAAADVEWSLLDQIKLDMAPLSMTLSPDGQWAYILGSAEVEVYSFYSGKVVTRIPLQGAYDTIAYSPLTSSLLIGSKTQKLVKIIRLDIVNKFDFTGLTPKGPATAPVAIAVFGDYQCPYCKSLLPVLQQVLDQFPKDVRLYFKNFPLPVHKFAENAARAAMAANVQGRFWEFHEKLFENMDSLDDAKVAEIAKELHLDLDRFTKDLKNSALQDVIDRDIVEGNAAQVSGTPTVFINGKVLKNTSLSGFQAQVGSVLEARKTAP